jgi:hypothetical protein
VEAPRQPTKLASDPRHRAELLTWPSVETPNLVSPGRQVASFFGRGILRSHFLFGLPDTFDFLLLCKTLEDFHSIIRFGCVTEQRDPTFQKGLLSFDGSH